MAVVKTGGFTEDLAQGLFRFGIVGNTTGALTVNGGSELLLTATNANNSPQLQFGRFSGTTGNGTVTGTNTKVIIQSNGNASEGAGLQIGRFGTGTLNVEAGALVSVRDLVGTTSGPDTVASEQILVGRELGANGTLNVSAATVEAIGTGAYATIGRAGATGTATFSHLSTLRLENRVANTVDDGTYINIGRANASGTLTFDASNLVMLTTANLTGSGISVGREGGGNGNLFFRNASVANISGAEYANFRVGRDGGTGNLEITGGSTVNLTSTAAGAGIGLGSGGGNGSLLIDGAGSLLRITSATGVHANIGFEGSTPSAGTGTLTLSNGGRMEWIKTQDFALLIGRGAGSTAAVNVLSGSRIDLTDDAAGGAFIGIGDRANVASATLRIDGANSLVEGANFVSVGLNPNDPNNGGGVGNGVLIVSNGGRLQAAQGVGVNMGGRLEGSGGTIQAHVSLNVGGGIGDLGGAIQTMTFSRGFSFNGGVIKFDVGATTNDVINVTGGSINIANDSIIINAVGGFKFAAGDQRVLISAGTGVATSISDTAFDGHVQITGQHADFSYLVGRLAGSNNVVFRALNSGTTGGNTVLDTALFAAGGAEFIYNKATGRGALVSMVSATGVSAAVMNIDGIKGTASSDEIGAFGNGPGFLIEGFAGNDVLHGGGNSADTMDGGTGIDAVDYSNATAGVTVRLDLNFTAKAGGINDTLISIEAAVGSNFADVLVSGGASFMNGGAGDDTIYGSNLDSVQGGAGTDVFFGGGGGALNLNLATQSLEVVWGSVVGDRMDGSGATANLVMIGVGGADTMLGGSGNDFIYFDHLDSISGGAGNDWAWAFGTTQGLTLNLNTSSFENVWGSPFNDSFTAAGATAAVVMVGDAGNDTLIGGNGADWLYGFSGNDSLVGGPGNDNLVGGEGADRFVFNTAGWGSDIIWDFARGADKIQLGGTSGFNNFAQVSAAMSTVNLPGFGNASLIVSGSNSIYVLNNPTLDASDFVFS